MLTGNKESSKNRKHIKSHKSNGQKWYRVFFWLGFLSGLSPVCFSNHFFFGLLVLVYIFSGFYLFIYLFPFRLCSLVLGTFNSWVLDSIFCFFFSGIVVQKKNRENEETMIISPIIIIIIGHKWFGLSWVFFILLEVPSFIRQSVHLLT